MQLNSLESLFGFLCDSNSTHNRNTSWYKFTKVVIKDVIENSESDFRASRPVSFAEIGEIVLPYYKMGSIESLDLFGLDELIIFAYYWKNKNYYLNAVDIGANIGLHSIVLGKLGYHVFSFEPDPVHFAILQKNLQLNEVAGRVETKQVAVSDKSGTAEFVRVLGNTTGSHLSGSKSDPYGDLERFPVDVVDIKSIIPHACLAKIDAEGHEVVLVKAIDFERWMSLDAFVEIGTSKNAADIFNYFKESSINIFSQKISWAKVNSIDEMPTSHREGGVFISARPSMTW